MDKYTTDTDITTALYTETEIYLYELCTVRKVEVQTGPGWCPGC